MRYFLSIITITICFFSEQSTARRLDYQYLSSQISNLGELPEHFTVEISLPKIKALAESLQGYVEGKNTEYSDELSLKEAQLLISIIDKIYGYHEKVRLEWSQPVLLLDGMSWIEDHQLHLRKELIEEFVKYFSVEKKPTPQFVFSFLNSIWSQLVAPPRLDLSVASLQKMKHQLSKWIELTRLLGRAVEDNENNLVYLNDQMIEYFNSLEYQLFDRELWNLYFELNHRSPIENVDAYAAFQSYIDQNSLAMTDFQWVVTKSSKFTENVRSEYEKIVHITTPPGRDIEREEIRSIVDLFQWLESVGARRSKKLQKEYKEYSNHLVETAKKPHYETEEYHQSKRRLFHRWSDFSPHAEKGIQDFYVIAREYLVRKISGTDSTGMRVSEKNINKEGKKKQGAFDPSNTSHEEFVNSRSIIEHLVDHILGNENHPKARDMQVKMLYHFMRIFTGYKDISLADKLQFADRLYRFRLILPQNFYITKMSEFILTQEDWPTLTRYEAYEYLQESTFADHLNLKPYQTMITEWAEQVQLKLGTIEIHASQYQSGFDLDFTAGNEAVLESQWKSMIRMSEIGPQLDCGALFKFPWDK